MAGFDPIFLEKRNIDDWLNESPDNIVIFFDAKLSFSKTLTLNSNNSNNYNYKIFCLKKQYLEIPNANDLYKECILKNNNLLVNDTFKSKNNYFDLGYYINKKLLINVNNIKKVFTKNKKNRIFKLDLTDKSPFVSKESLLLSNIELYKPKKLAINKDINIEEQNKIKKLNAKIDAIDKKNLPYKKNVYFEYLLSKALLDYSFQWDAPVNSYLRLGENYFSSQIFKNYHRRYGSSLESAANAVKNKVNELDRVFLEAAPINDDSKTIYYRGMKTKFENLDKIGDKTIIKNFISVSKSFDVAIRFSGVKAIFNTNRCCMYIIKINEGIPFVDMINTTKYKHEKEVLLPRNLEYEVVDIKTYYILPGAKKNPYNVYVLQASAAHGSQFKIKNNCALYNIGKLEVYNYKFNNKKVEAKKVETKKVETKKVDTNKYSKRCPNGMRRNKLTNNCESIKNTSKTKKSPKAKKSPKTNKEKLPRCPNGTRRNKETKICEKFN